MRLYLLREGEALLVDLHRACRRDPRLARVRVALITEHQTVAFDEVLVRALLLQRVLDLEQIGEVAAGLDPDLHVDRLLVVVQDRQLLAETVADGPLADHRQLGVDVDGAGPRHEEEARLEVLKIVRRQGVETLRR